MSTSTMYKHLNLHIYTHIDKHKHTQKQKHTHKNKHKQFWNRSYTNYPLPYTQIVIDLSICVCEEKTSKFHSCANFEMCHYHNLPR